MILNIFVSSVLFVAVHSMGVPFNMGDCSSNPQCPEGFKKFDRRANGAWCMKVIPGNMTWWEAERECRCSTRGAHLSGVETTTENQWVEQQGQNILDNGNIKDGAIWIGAYRRKECPPGALVKNAVCDAETLFQFTDQHTCNTYIFQNWAGNQPSNSVGDDCAVLLVSTESSGANSDASGKTAAKNCLQVTGSTPIMSSIGYVCGVKPAEPDNSYGGNGGYGGGEIVMIGAAKPTKKG